MVPPAGEPGSTAPASGLVENDVTTGSRGLIGPSAGEPLVTVITATYNRSGILRHALRSLQLQTFTAWESWVVGDGCTDDSEAVVAAFGDARMHWTNLPANSGSQATPNNEGIRRARGRYIAYLSHDDLWLPWHLESLLQCIQEQEADLAHALLAMIGRKGADGVGGAAWGPAMYENAIAPPSSWLHRRDIVETCGGWADPLSISLPIDREFMRRIYRSGKRIVAQPRLSVLKFRAASWKMYTLSGDYPQEGYLQAIETDARTLHERLLLDLVLALARRHYQPTPAGTAFRQAFARLIDTMVDRYGRYWPLSPLIHRRFQRRRRRNLRARGLPR